MTISNHSQRVFCCKLKDMKMKQNAFSEFLKQIDVIGSLLVNQMKENYKSF